MEHQPSSNMACLTPFTGRDKATGEAIAFPCGKCPECTKRRISEWSFRLMQEEKHSDSAHFITLTYNTKHVPITKAGFLTLNKRDLQTFFKRLRFNTGAKNIKYYAVGEYGTDKFRPHYHALVFNLPHTDDVLKAWITDKRKTKIIEPLGECHFGTITGASVGYTLKYISKRRIIPVHRNDDRLPEFALQSKGLGSSYLTEAAHAWHHADLNNRMHIQIEGGKKISMPRYFKNKIYTDHDRENIGAFQAPLIEKRRQDIIDKDYQGDEYKFLRDQSQQHYSQFRKAEKLSNEKKGKL
jgi:hypothetical protein